MCIIVYKPAGVEMPAKTVWENCWSSNHDGIGLMYREKGKVRIKKGFMSLQAFEKALEHLKRKTDLNALDLVVHFRFATHGTVNPGNCHPFPVTGNLKRMQEVDLAVSRALAHNGILHKFAPPKSLKVSDTMYFIYKNHKNINRILKDTDGKFVLMTSTKTQIFGKFVQEDGVFYSNNGYSTPAYTYISNSKYWGVATGKSEKAKKRTRLSVYDPEQVIKCCECGEKVKRINAIHVINKEYLCSTCYDQIIQDTLEYCDQCGKIVTANELEYKNRQFLCKDCSEALNLDWWEHMKCI